MAKGSWVTSGYKPGDLLIFDFGSPGIDHIGILEKVNPDGSLITVEGNTGVGNDANGGAVMRRTRYTKNVIGACRPAYTEAMPAEKVLQIARGQIGVVEEPRNSNKVKYNDAYYGRPVSGPDYKWCVVFIWWCFSQAGMAPIFYGGGKTASCTTLATFYGYKKAPAAASTKKVSVALPELRKGSEGASVRALQCLINSMGVVGLTPLQVDGDFGDKTDDAVRRLQRALSLTIDGVVGVDTWTRLLT
jgi:peptidoglycan hydrolase-like protein with peptidoglycan-binding domain